eukprot:CAMPEP_0173373152 /NCGR_PEP_ID=MMETSP1144-20121109/28325_1 /TAXON_ID=483371 /ORGANISM="non described non described, Strain CCMP2298" /LENGTH=58 /DNA_ID=CAMNT_0014325267 /DNA_START=282 /DNA_END=458 /DNA_ORIENTATION=+
MGSRTANSSTKSAAAGASVSAAIALALPAPTPVGPILEQQVQARCLLRMQGGESPRPV